MAFFAGHSSSKMFCWATSVTLTVLILFFISLFIHCINLLFVSASMNVLASFIAVSVSRIKVIVLSRVSSGSVNSLSRLGGEVYISQRFDHAALSQHFPTLLCEEGDPMQPRISVNQALTSRFYWLLSDCFRANALHCGSCWRKCDRRGGGAGRVGKPPLLSVCRGSCARRFV